MPPTRSSFLEVGVFTAASFLSALLLFSVQPMVARMLLPLLGGAPAVWNTCLVFFQFLLLAGYLYSHWLSGRSAQAQRWIQLAVLGSAIFFLPIALPEWAKAPDTERPVSWLLAALVATVSVPFFALSAHAPLLQVWLAKRRRNPYFLYSASNAGSLLALAAYPILIEPALSLPLQAVVWMFGFAVMIPLVWMASAPRAAVEAPVDSEESSSGGRFLWIALAFVPSSLLQGITTYLTTDLASIPLLWVMPLAIYLLTFVIAFAERTISAAVLERPIAIGAVALILLLAMEAVEPVWLMLAIHLIFFSLACLYCHVRLAAAKPAPARLTDFYVCMSVGGALGGAFNSLVAPLIFTNVLEYPIAIVLACLARSYGWQGTPRQKGLDVAIPILVGVTAAASAIVGPLAANKLGLPAGPMLFGALALCSFFMMNRPLRFAGALAGILLGSLTYSHSRGKVLHAERNFFGVLRVTLDPSGPFHRLWHGTTIHGLQYARAENSCEPLGYYWRDSGLGLAWEMARGQKEIRNVAVVGLGAGASMAYSEPGQHWTVYEIDPAVIRVASNTNFFSYLNGCARGTIDFKVGDARLRIAEAKAGSLDFLALDAFSSDTVPMHLLTREAVRLYGEKLAPGGVMVFHVSSRNLRLEPVVTAVAEAEGFLCFKSSKQAESDDRLGRFESDWLVAMRAGEIPEALNDKKIWRRAQPPANAPIWTDDFCNLWSVIDLK